MASFTCSSQRQSCLLANPSRLRSNRACPCASSRCAAGAAAQSLALMIDCAPEIKELAIGLHNHLVQMPAQLRIGSHLHDLPLSDLGSQYRPKNRFHQNRTVSRLMSIPRSAQRSSTLRSDSGYLTYIIMTRRMTFWRAVEISERVAHVLKLARPHAAPQLLY